MAFRFEAKTFASLMIAAGLAHAAQQTYKAEYKHLPRSSTVSLVITDDSISFDEAGKKAKHFVWKYEDIRQLTLSPGSLRVLTYDDNRLLAGRDREYFFDKLPPKLAEDWYPVFSARLDKRFVAALADPQIKPLWTLPAKMLHGPVGSQGTLEVGADSIVFRAGPGGESRTWRMSDIDNVSSSDSLDLSITTREREFRFQLKRELDEANFQTLWQKVNRAHGLKILN